MKNKCIQQEIARLANCSVTQVSRALNGRGRISAATREKVLKIAAELNYRNTSRLVQVQGERVTLTHKEFSLLCLLLQNRERVMTRDRLLNEIWGYAYDGECRTVDVHIRTLRQKLGVAGDYIETVRGIGYKIGGRGD